MSAYCRHLEEAYLVSFLPFYTLKSAERLRRPSKVHAIDPGLRNAISLSGAPDRGRLMETAVHNALLGEDSDGLFYWKGQGEVDLAVRRGLGIERLIQVTDEGLLDPVSRRREIEALVEASSVFPGAELLDRLADLLHGCRHGLGRWQAVGQDACRSMTPRVIIST